MNKKLLSALILIVFCVVNITAQNIESGKVYRFNNIGKPGYNLSLSGAVQAAVGLPANSADLKQQWYVVQNAAKTGFYLRNATNGAYLTSPKVLYTQWPVTFTSNVDDDTMLMAFGTYDNNLTIKAANHNNNYAFAHCDGSNNIVCWLNTSTPTQWTAEEVPMTEAQIQEMLKRFTQTGDEIAKASTYETYLDALFSDKACTNLKVSGDLSSNTNYTSLPQTLKTMVDKVNSGNWSETDGNWDSDHAKKYRVQLYEPYSEGSAAAGLAGIQAYTNMNNPTGIIANAGEMIYVMVDSDIPSGATLYIGGVPDCSMYNSVTAGTKLKKGLNMILCNADLTHYFIYYTVNSVENRQPVRKISDYPEVVIHIEGGRVNGFFNHVGDRLYTADTKDDFEYTTQRAKHPMYDMLGKYVILHFFLEDTPDLPGGTPQICVKNAFNRSRNSNMKHDDPVVTMKAWDDMCFAERILMGIQSEDDIKNSYNRGMYESIVNDGYEKAGFVGYPTFSYSDYFNNRMMGITLQAQGLYMNATSWRTAYAASTVSAILSQFPEDGIWGPAHEYGHINQSPISIAGTTEESNNVFSNVANFFVCNTTSRCDYPSSQLKHFNAGDTYLQNETWGTTRMFWQLWCYYHATGHNKKFYPRLFELLRKYPLKRETTTYPGKLNGKADMLQFVRMCCIASGEDLTNFFASWGFFNPQDTYHIDDYSVYDLILTQQDIDDVKNEIKSWNLPKNDAIILIDDRPGSTLREGFGYNKDLCGQYGGLSSFTGNTPASGDFTFTVDGNNVTVTGTGNPGAGFLVYDENGELIGFSNSDSFTLSNEAAQALVDGKATVKAVGADNSVVEAVDPVRKGSVDTKKELLKSLIDRCDALLALSDNSLSHVGRLYPDSCKDLTESRNDAYDVWETVTDSERLTDEYLALSKVYYALLNDETARIPVEPGAAYRLINHNYKDRALDAGASNLVATTFNTASESVPFSQLWIFEPVTEGNSSQYYLRNLGDGRYISTTKKQSTSIPLGTTPQSYTFITVEHEVYTFAPDNEVRFGIHIDGSHNVVQWNTTSLPTQWSMVKVCSKKQIELRQQLSDKVAEAEALLATAGSMERSEPKEYVFPDDCLYSNAPYTSQKNADYFNSWKVLFDNDINTYFHSNYDNTKDSEDGLDHYIRMKAPDDGEFRFIDLSYITRNVANTGTNPKSIVIEASKDMKEWKEIFHATGLKTGAAVTNELGEIVCPEGTKYIRFMVTGATSLAKGHPYFCLSELNVNDLGEPIFTPDEGFPYLKGEDMDALFNDIVDGKLDLANSSTDVEELTGRLQQIEQASNTIQSLMIPAVDVTSLSFPVDPIVIKVGDEPLTVSVVVEPENATFPQFDWQISDELLAAIVSMDGKSVEVKPLSNGVTDINVKVVGNPLVGASAVLKVLPQVPVSSVVISPSEVTLPLNAGVVTLNTAVYPDNATIPALTWSSSDPSVVEVDETTGELTLLRQGVAEITATTTDGTELSAKGVVTVSNPVAEGLLIYPENANLEQGEEINFSATYLPVDADQPVIVWTSSAPEIAEVDPSGRVIAKMEGEAVITVSTEVNGKTISASANVTVLPLTLKAITLTPVSATIAKGESAVLEISLQPQNIQPDLLWTLSDENIVNLSVDNSMLTANVTALNPGMVLVTVSSVSNPDLSASCLITVPEIAVTDLKIEISDTFLNAEDGKQPVKVIILPIDAPTPRVLWVSSDESVATIEAVSPTDAEINPIGNGKTLITVYHADKPEIYDSVEIDISGASAIASLFEDKTTKVDVYEISGQIVKKNVSLNSLGRLKPGIYIIRQGKNSKEVIVR